MLGISPRLQPLGKKRFRLGNSIAFKAFLLTAVTIFALFLTIFLILKTQVSGLVQGQHQATAAMTARESFRLLAQHYNDKPGSDAIVTPPLPGDSQDEFEWAWIRSEPNGSLSVVRSSAPLPCSEVARLANRFESANAVTSDKSWVHLCAKHDTLAVLYPDYIPDGNARISVIAWRSMEKQAPLDHLNSEFSGMLLVGLLLAFLISRAISYSLSTPIQMMAKAASDMADGEYTHQLHVERRDELGELASAFNKMAQAVSEREGQVRRLAYIDELTGLYNRTFFLKVLQERIEQSFEREFVIVWDIDRFKVINEVLGFSVGDTVLKVLGQRFATDLKDAVILARLGGNTFAMLVPASLGNTMESQLNLLFHCIETPVSVDGQPLDVSATTGISEFPAHGLMAEDLLRRAEIARFHAKRARLRWLAYRPQFEVSSTSRLSMLSELKIALETRGQLQLYLQPKLNTQSGRIDQAEALIRWHHPERGLIPPNEFIPFAEQTGRISELTVWAIGHALELLEQTRTFWPLQISVNVSAQDLEQEGFADKVILALKKSKLPAHTLCLEITESAAMSDPERAMKTLIRLNMAGISLSIDDFGTGYSSLSYLKRFPVDELKIDRSLVAGVRDGTDGEIILRSTIELAHNMGLSVTAEGVETEEEMTLLKKIGIDHIQGYLIAKPMPLVPFTDFMMKFHEETAHAN